MVIYGVSLGSSTPGPCSNIKMLWYQLKKSHCGDKTILWPSYLHNGISCSDDEIFILNQGPDLCRSLLLLCYIQHVVILDHVIIWLCGELMGPFSLGAITCTAVPYQCLQVTAFGTQHTSWKSGACRFYLLVAGCKTSSNHLNPW